jgi:hypothetical protein
VLAAADAVDDVEAEDDAEDEDDADDIPPPP